MTGKNQTQSNVKKLLLSTTALTLGGLMTLAMPSVAYAVDVDELPTGEAIATGNGSATFDRSTAKQLNVTQNSKRVIIDWKSFNIGRQASVDFNQTQGNDSVAVNRVGLGAGDPTKILGSLSANGRLVVLDANGVIFGNNAQVDVGGLIASTGNLKSDNKFMSGSDQFGIVDTDQYGAKQAVVNKGTITVAQGGLAAFVAPYVRNKGTITAKLGRVTLAAGQRVTVDLTGDELISIAPGKKLQKALSENTGTLSAEGGTITMSANAAKDVVDDVINMDGFVNANSFESKNGKIILGGGSNGRVRVAGNANASSNGATKGGEIKIDGAHIDVTDTANLNASAVSDGGSITIGDIGTKALAVDAGADLLAASVINGNGGSIKLWAKNSTMFKGTANVSGSSTGTGGTVYIGTGGQNLGFFGEVFLGAGAGTFGSLTLEAAKLKLASAGSFGEDDFVVHADKVAEALLQGDVNLVGGNVIETAGKGDIDLRSFETREETITTYVTEQRIRIESVYIGDDFNGRPIYANQPVIYFVQVPVITTVEVTELAEPKGDVTMTSPLLRIRKNNDIIMGTANLTLNVPTVNLNAKIYGSNTRSLLSTSQLKTTTSLVNVISNHASLQQGVDLLNDDMDDKPVLRALTDVVVKPKMTVAYGKYTENFVVNKSIDVVGLGRNEEKTAPILMADDTSKAIVRVTADDVTFDNFDLRAGKPTPVEQPEAYDLRTALFVGGFAPQIGLKVKGADNALVQNSSFTGFDVGVKLKDATNTTVTKNTITGLGAYSGSMGVKARGGKNLFILDNDIVAQNYGVDVHNVQEGRVRIADNTIDDTNYGVHVGNVDKVRIADNTMTAVYYGIEANNIGTLLRIARNNIDGANAGTVAERNDGYVGISVFEANDADIINNTVSNFQLGGIALAFSNRAYLERNTTNFTGNGVMVFASNGVTAFNNTINSAGFSATSESSDYPFELTGNGFLVVGSDRVRLEENTVNGASNDGIRAMSIPFFGCASDECSNTAFEVNDGPSFPTSSGLRLVRNNLYKLGDDGIDLSNQTNAIVRGNYIDDAYDTGIAANTLTNSVIRRNRVLDPMMTGIDIFNSSDVVIDKNRIRKRNSRVAKLSVGSEVEFDVYDDYYYNLVGINVAFSDNIDVTENQVRNMDTGFQASGPFNGDITLADNLFENNTVGAEFNSGSITLGGVNTFNGGDTAMIFSPAFLKGRFPFPPQGGFPGKAIVSDIEGRPSLANLELVGNTLGQTVFSGQSKNYIVLENGALFNPGTPTVINGVGATFDGLSGPLLTKNKLNTIENKIVDFDDLNSLGQIFVGFTPTSTGLIDQEDVLRQILAVLGITGNNANVVITGLPSIPGASNTLVSILSALSPAAGEGTTAEALNNLSPAAGGEGEEVACWAQAANVFSANTTGQISYSLGGDSASLLSDLAGCSI